MRYCLALVVFLAACGPDVEAECEWICEWGYQCLGSIPVESVDECEADCVDDVSDDAECAQAIADLHECLGDDCGDPDCASEANAVENECI